ncbi:hypothetical protein UC8_36600 [Roseimaritima ulvae]|uniref:Uncharacterized protein n=1 Tax=Roseimaritima ulvae TaxID=980254 RepID=A0A5B9QRK3_9BACT|nr:hypothetical protein UC8_36600 [Roseimaritima ulvae]
MESPLAVYNGSSGAEFPARLPLLRKPHSPRLS